jgi:hypothetical protein
MIKRRSGFGLAAEAFQGLQVMGDVRRQKLESNKAVEARVLSFIDYAHATAADVSIMR